MKSSKRIYIALQILGWSAFFMGNVLSSALRAQNEYISFTSVFKDLFPPTLILIVLGILISHGFRELVHKFGWNSLSVIKIAPIWILSSILMSLVFCALSYLIFVVLLNNLNNVLNIEQSSFFNIWVNISVIFLVWSLIYFVIHIFQNFKAAEISNLKLKAANTQMELIQLRSQMNPHFLFNSLNSVRALIDEDPEKSKEAINLISGLLRYSLGQNKEKTVPFSEEIEMIKRYVGIEKIRFEERIEVLYDLDPKSMSLPVPPMSLQTLVENAIKHGINKKKEGGTIRIRSKVHEKMHQIEVSNPGKIKKSKDQGYGIQNTSDRIQLIYGTEASFKLSEENDMVIAKINLPIN